MLRRNGSDIPIEEGTEVQAGDELKVIFSEPISINASMATLVDADYYGLLFVKQGSNLLVSILEGLDPHEEDEWKRARNGLYILQWTAVITNYNGQPLSEVIMQGNNMQWLPEKVTNTVVLSSFTYPSLSVLNIGGSKCLGTADGKLILCGNGNKNYGFDSQWPAFTVVYYSDRDSAWMVGEEMVDVDISWPNTLQPYVQEHGYVMWPDTVYAVGGLTGFVDGKVLVMQDAVMGRVSRNVFCPPIPSE